MQPIIRLTDYINEYKNLTYDEYASQHLIVPTTYFSLNRFDTKFDKNYVGTYYDSGEMTGKKWDMIHLFPVISPSSLSPRLNSSNKGVNFGGDLTSDCIIDPISGLIPKVGDILEFNIKDHYGYYQVINLERSGALINPYYKCQLQLFRPNTKTGKMARSNINKQYIFVEYAKKIYPLDIGSTFIRRMARLNLIIDKLNACYNPQICAHVINNNTFPELETILTTFKSAMPPTQHLMVEDLGRNPLSNSLIALLVLPEHADQDIDRSISKTEYNPKLKLFSNFNEYSSEHGKDNLLQLIYDYNFYDPIENTINNFDYYRSMEFNKELEGQCIKDPLTLLLLELAEVVYSDNIDYKYELNDSISTNLLEYVMEYCIISRKVIKNLGKTVELF